MDLSQTGIKIEGPAIRQVAIPTPIQPAPNPGGWQESVDLALDGVLRGLEKFGEGATHAPLRGNFLVLQQLTGTTTPQLIVSNSSTGAKISELGTIPGIYPNSGNYKLSSDGAENIFVLDTNGTNTKLWHGVIAADGSLTWPQNGEEIANVYAGIAFNNNSIVIGANSSGVVSYFSLPLDFSNNPQAIGSVIGQNLGVAEIANNTLYVADHVSDMLTWRSLSAISTELGSVATPEGLDDFGGLSIRQGQIFLSNSEGAVFESTEAME